MYLESFQLTLVKKTISKWAEELNSKNDFLQSLSEKKQRSLKSGAKLEIIRIDCGKSNELSKSKKIVESWEFFLRGNWQRSRNSQYLKVGKPNFILIWGRK